MKDSAFAGFENTSQPEAIVALVKSSRYDYRHDRTSRSCHHD
jgi:hypothetical protein